jgi:hypothetical protein
MERRQFRMVFLSVLVITLLCGAATVVIAVTNDTLSSVKQQLFNSLLSLFMLGAGAIIGLIGSNPKTSERPDRQGQHKTDGNSD